jgi:hypothetical protein
MKPHYLASFLLLVAAMFIAHRNIVSCDNGCRASRENPMGTESTKMRSRRDFPRPSSGVKAAGRTEANSDATEHSDAGVIANLEEERLLQRGREYIGDFDD